MAYLPQQETPLATSDTRVAKEYIFNAGTGVVRIKDADFDTALIIINSTDNIVIYNPLEPGLGGTVSNNIITLNYDTSSMSDSDKLFIIYQKQKEYDKDNLLYLILEELEKQSKLLKKYIVEVYK